MELIQPTDPQRGKRPIFTCPFHSWAFASDGNLVNVPFEQGFASEAGGGLDDLNLVELPSLERGGLLFVCATAWVELDPEVVLPVDLATELEAMQVGSAVCAYTQELTMRSNWKLGVDTFGETYHFSSLHQGLSQVFLTNQSDFRTFGEGRAQRHSCMTLASTAVKAVLDDPSKELPWAIDHVNLVYHLAPNSVLIVGGDETSIFTFWPGDTVGSCILNVSRYMTSLLEDMESAFGARIGFYGLLAVTALEDFPATERIQANLDSTPGARINFGRNEPALQDRHRFFEELARNHKPTSM